MDRNSWNVVWFSLLSVAFMISGAILDQAVHIHDVGQAYQAGREQGRKESLDLQGRGDKVGYIVIVIPNATGDSRSCGSGSDLHPCVAPNK